MRGPCAKVGFGQSERKMEVSDLCFFVCSCVVNAIYIDQNYDILHTYGPLEILSKNTLHKYRCLVYGYF